MQGPLALLFYAALAGVFAVLAYGIFNLVRQDENQASRSNQLMRLRVLLQFVAVLALVGIGWFAGAFG